MFHFFGPPGGNHFEGTYRAFPLAFIDKQSAEYGDKVILPPSALDRLGECRVCCCCRSFCHEFAALISFSTCCLPLAHTM